ncbi:hypothetical protein HK405_009213, partial [Cladochytrium tenue]
MTPPNAILDTTCRRRPNAHAPRRLAAIAANAATSRVTMQRHSPPSPQFPRPHCFRKNQEANRATQTASRASSVFGGTVFCFYGYLGARTMLE